MQSYNGYPSWAQWNVALWIFNDEGLYRLAREYRRRYRSARLAAQAMLEVLPDKTPDGARYSMTAVARAMREV